ncbi:anthrone oxygenase family protein [Pelagibacterium xiamenense]|uniref:anthrone oxygenase family protein n=1 Tax=Pelagibacterium xiamenense TaxID=2901140 RepID=UPI001E455F1C|nr:anthrone oxygenase family protein [Pelagibacterium xiamenense]MCD7061160.1 DUF1772 domain-containing protein [Pelagibacterium xiamenense]
MTYLAGILATLALLTSAIMAGFFFSYSVSVMWGFDAAAPGSAIDGMQKINTVIQNAWFFPSFFGAPVFAVLAAIVFWAMGMRDVGVVFGLAGLCYLIGAFGITVAVNVPMNEALGRESIPLDAEAARALWMDYSTRWTWWNHIRTIASIASALLCGLALFLAGRASA